MSHSFLFEFLGNSGLLGYVAFYFITFVEGDATLFTAAFLVREGLFNGPLMFLTILAGTFTIDTFWYLAGIRFRTHAPPRFFKWFERAVAPFDEHLQTRPLRTMLISQFAYSMNRPLIMRAGTLGIPLKKFVRYNLITTVIWVLVVGGLGYGSGATFELLRKSLRFAEVGLLLALVGFLLISHMVAWYSKSKL